MKYILSITFGILFLTANSQSTPASKYFEDVAELVVKHPDNNPIQFSMGNPGNVPLEFMKDEPVFLADALAEKGLKTLSRTFVPFSENCNCYKVVVELQNDKVSCTVTKVYEIIKKPDIYRALEIIASKSLR